MGRPPIPFFLLLLLAHPTTVRALVVPLRYSSHYAAAAVTSSSSSSILSFPFQSSGDKALVPAASGNSSSSTHLIAYEPGFFAYFAQLSFQGGQVIDVLIDTGSHDLLVPTTLCTECQEDVVSQRLDIGAADAAMVACEDAACRGQCTPQLLADFGFLDRKDSPQSVCGPHGGVCEEVGGRCLFLDYYADGSHASGVLVTSAAVGFAGMEVDNMTFGAIDSASDSFFEAPQGGGILGMAFRREAEEGCDDTPCMMPLLDVLVKQKEDGEGMKDSFAVYGHPSAPVMFVGASSVSQESKGYYDGDLAYVQMHPPHGLYMVGVGGMAFQGGVRQGEEEEEKRLMQAPGVAIIDTGATGMFFPTDVYQDVKAYLQTHYCHIPFICGPEASPPPPLTQPQKNAQQQQHQQQHSHTTRFLRGRHHHHHHHHQEAIVEEEVQPTIFDDNIWANWDNTTLSLLPTLLIHLSGGGEGGGRGKRMVEVKLTPAQYMTQSRLRGEEDGAQVYYTFGISTFGGGEKEEEKEGGESGSPQAARLRRRRKYQAQLSSVKGGKGELDEVFVFGEMLLNHYFVHFDREGKRLGFAPAVPQAPSSL